MVVEWPDDIRGRIEGFPFLRAQSVTAGPGLDQREQIVKGENSIWEFRISVGRLAREKILSWAAFIDDLEGRANPFRFKVWNTFALPTSGALPDGGVSAVSAGAPEASTIISMIGYSAENVRKGGLFSINDFLYRVKENNGGVVTFAPPLREAVTAGDLVYFSGPTVLLRMADGEGGRIFPTGMRISDGVTFTAVEAFER